MASSNYYDPTQLTQDLRQIVRVRGTRKPHGFYTATEFDDKDIIITELIGQLQVQLRDDRGVFVFQRLNRVNMESDLAQLVLKMIIHIES